MPGPVLALTRLNPHQGPHVPPVLQVRKRLAGGDATQAWLRLLRMAGDSLSIPQSYLPLPVGTPLQGPGSPPCGGPAPLPHTLHSFRESPTWTQRVDSDPLVMARKAVHGGLGGRRWPF